MRDVRIRPFGVSLFPYESLSNQWLEVVLHHGVNKILSLLLQSFCPEELCERSVDGCWKGVIS